MPGSPGKARVTGSFPEALGSTLPWAYMVHRTGKKKGDGVGEREGDPGWDEWLLPEILEGDLSATRPG